MNWSLRITVSCLWGLLAYSAQAAPPNSGLQLYQYWCATCHGRGNDKPGTTALAAKYDGAEPALLEERNDLNAEMVRNVVRHGISVMPSFRKTEISDAELARIADYLVGKDKH